MKQSFLVLATLSLLVSSGCSTFGTSVREGTPALINTVDGTVLSVSGNEVLLSMVLAEAQRLPSPTVTDIAEQIVRRGLFIEGIVTTADGMPINIKTIRGRNMTVTVEDVRAFSPGTVVRLTVPRKTLAIMDLEVIRGKDEKAARVMLEELTSALIETGQFVVVERSKLSAVLSEMELSLSGLTSEPAEKMVGRLLNADLILTGTLAEAGGEWDVNLRLVNARTGQAHAAVMMRTPRYRPDSIRDTGPLDEVFEGEKVDASWMTGKKAKGIYSVNQDPGTGISGSKSLRMDYDLSGGDRDFYLHAEDRKKRDLSSYRGIEFYVRATGTIQGHVRILLSDREDPLMMDAWVAGFNIGREWKKVRVSFEEFTIARRWIKAAARIGLKPGRQMKDLSQLESFSIGFNSRLNPAVRGSVWIDNISFYRD